MSRSGCFRKFLTIYDPDDYEDVNRSQILQYYEGPAVLWHTKNSDIEYATLSSLRKETLGPVWILGSRLPCYQ